MDTQKDIFTNFYLFENNSEGKHIYKETNFWTK